MKHPDVHREPFRAPSLAPLAAHLGNVLFTRQTWKIALGNTVAMLRPVPDLVPFSPACSLALRCGKSLWRVDLGSMEILRAHEALTDVPEDTPLPIELRQAVLELLAEPIIAYLSNFLGVPVRLESLSESIAPDANNALPWPEAAVRLSFELLLPSSGTSRESVTRIPISIDVPDADNARMLLARLKSLPQQNAFDSSSPWAQMLHRLPVSVSVEAGRMKLRQDEISALALDDILLPVDYPAARGALTLRFLSGEDGPQGAGLLESPNTPSVLCAVDSLTATVTGFLPLLQESFMNTDTDSQVQNQPNADSQNAQSARSDSPQNLAGGNEQTFDTGALELIVSFELERRLMSVQDISALSPGYTFAIGSDALSPVTVRVNGKAIGAGRLVDVQGVLGIQITELGV